MVAGGERDRGAVRREHRVAARLRGQALRDAAGCRDPPEVAFAGEDDGVSVKRGESVVAGGGTGGGGGLGGIDRQGEGWKQAHQEGEGEPLGNGEGGGRRGRPGGRQRPGEMGVRRRRWRLSRPAGWQTGGGFARGKAGIGPSILVADPFSNLRESWGPPIHAAGCAPNAWDPSGIARRRTASSTGEGFLSRPFPSRSARVGRRCVSTARSAPGRCA